MSTHRTSLTEAKQNLGELVKRTAYGGDRFVLEFRGKPRAALVSYEDLERLENIDSAPASRRDALEQLKSLGERIRARTDEVFDSVRDLEQVRQERLDQLSGLR